MSIDMALQLLNGTRDNLFIHGAGGTGKTHLLRNYTQSADISSDCIERIVAPTGLAASNYAEVGGQTIHSLFRITPTKDSILRFNPRLLQPNPDLNNAHHLEDLELLIIDEVSMVRSDLFQYMHAYLQYVKGNTLFFGGIRLILVGDLYQLPPVTLPGTRRKLNDFGCASEWFFDAPCFNAKNFTYIELTVNLRQGGEDDPYAEWLKDIRTNTLPAHQRKLLNTELNSEPAENPVYICSTNRKVAAINQQRLALIKAEPITFSTLYALPTAILRGRQLGSLSNSTSEPQIAGFTTLDYIPEPFTLIREKYPEDLTVAVGARVVVLINDFERNLYNGLLATVIDIEDHSIQILKDDNTTATIYRRTEEVAIINEITSKTTKAYISQFPLALAFALTVHKTQGLTLKKTHIDIDRSWYLPGMCYVALSRNPTLKTTTSKHKFIADMFAVNRRVSEFVTTHLKV